MPDNGNGEKKKRNLSPETRERLRQAAIKRHKEGKLGGAEFGKLGGRPRKDRAAKRVADAAAEDENAKAIISVLKDATRSGQPMGIRLQGAKLWVDIEREEAKTAMAEEKHDADTYTREELIQVLAQKLTEGPTAEIIRQALEEGIPDADFVELGLEDSELEGAEGGAEPEAA